MKSTLAGAPCISVGQKQRRGRKGLGKQATQTTFYGFTAAEVLRLGKKSAHLLTRKERTALESYWDNRLAVMGEDVGRGLCNWVTYEPDIAVLDFFAEDKTYILPNGERQEQEE